MTTKRIVASQLKPGDKSGHDTVEAIVEVDDDWLVVVWESNVKPSLWRVTDAVDVTEPEPEWVPTHAHLVDGSQARLVALVLENENGDQFQGNPEVWRPLSTPTGHACERCGATLAECDAAIVDFGRGCCAACVRHDTHGLLA